jgi:molecular chaperone GrpE
MATDDNEPQNQPSTEESAKEKEDRQSRAKAFYRALYAGGEPDPENFGIDLGNKPQQNDAASQAALNHMQDQLKEQEQKSTEWENAYKRLAADFENYRKRIDREREEFQAVGMQRALEAVLPALDDLDMAQSKLTEATESKVMLQSLKMVYTRFARCLESVGIKQMEVIGEPFDPKFHEPVQEVATNEVPEGAVVHQLRAGYMFRDKVLRPSLVNVATALSAEQAELQAPSSSQEPPIEPEQEVADNSDGGQAADESSPSISGGFQAHFTSSGQTEAAPSSGIETADSLDALEDVSIMRSTVDLPVEEIKAALEASERAAQLQEYEAAEAAAGSGGDSGKVYDLTDVED